uniref:Uncharacterized protein n=1 Tax=Romanomermis culicivorax TaxID=13658 RepID=A0A915K4J3_ROMCU
METHLFDNVALKLAAFSRRYNNIIKIAISTTGSTKPYDSGYCIIINCPQHCVVGFKMQKILKLRAESMSSPGGQPSYKMCSAKVDQFNQIILLSLAKEVNYAKDQKIMPELVPDLNNARMMPDH